MAKSPKVFGFAVTLSLVMLGGWQDVSFANLPPGIVRYSGRATVLRANVNVVTSTTKVLLADTGELDSNGATKDATVVTFDNPAPLEVHSKTAHAIAAGANNVSAATAAVRCIRCPNPRRIVVVSREQSRTSPTRHPAFARGAC